MVTLLLGILFSGMQLLEYKNAPFTFTDSIYGSCFFFATGFHGLHSAPINCYWSKISNEIRNLIEISVKLMTNLMTKEVRKCSMS